MNTPVAILLSQKGSSVYSVPTSVTVAEAVHVMNQHHVGCVVVMDAGRMTGIFTERDVMSRVVSCGRTPSMTSISDAMTRNPVTVGPRASVEEVLVLFSLHHCRHIPVLDEETDPPGVLGIITVGDVNRWMLGEYGSATAPRRTSIGAG
ncbi:CBS domain-containing protein [Termitidicoccus mucosus]|uniref:CBS domain-containing protein n=1 Tax=Termitidicoccus mucosus TaxID=1184151 RepID=UPI0009FBA8C6